MTLILLLAVGWFSAVADKPVWFVQITDTHISYLEEPERIHDLKFFLKHRLHEISPKVVVLSGDITHGITKQRLGGQVEEEWKTYKSLLKEANVDDPEFWIDVRGNHDVFRVHDWHSKTNYYRSFSARSKPFERFHTHVIRENNKNYVICTIDTTMEPGLGRALNFYGMIPKDQLELLSEVVHNASAIATGGAPVFVGHQPVVYVHTKYNSFRSYLSVGAYYLCGHLHTFLGFVPNMYYKHSSELVELELGDWKNSRLYRIAAWDEGKFSFVDVALNDPFVVLVTNPKMPGLSVSRETKISMSPQLRMLIFSFVGDVQQVTIQEGNLAKRATLSNEEYPLWTAAWNFKLHQRSILNISIMLSNGTVYSKLHEICPGCDGFKYGIGAKMALDFINIDMVYTMFLLLLVSRISILLFFRFYNLSPQTDQTAKRRIWFRFQLKMNRLCNLSFCFYGLLLSDLYSLIGPWVIGELTDTKFGVSFLWGTVLGDDRLPSDVLVVSAAEQSLLVQYPALFALAALLNWRLDNNAARFNCSTRRYVYFLSNFVLLYSVLASCVVVVANFWSFPYFILLSWLTVFNPWILIALWMYVLLTPLKKIKAAMRRQCSMKPL